MDVAIVTGSNGLVGSEAVRFLSRQGMQVVGIDNDLRKHFFGDGASTRRVRDELMREIPEYDHRDIDIREIESLRSIFGDFNTDIKLIVHAASQPSHDWSARDPLLDFSVNAQATLQLLELTRQWCPDAVFEFMSTNKVYGDTPNRLPLVELDSRWELAETHAYFENGIDESMSVDNCTHSLFGVSKTAADLMVQEYGRYFGLHSVCFRMGCITGPAHAGAELHGFLAYLLRCALEGDTYTIFGYSGKQVRDNIHSYDLMTMIWEFYLNPRVAEVYNAGGGRFANCSVIEAITLCERITGKKFNSTYHPENRIGDHIWWVSDPGKFRAHFPNWDYRYDLEHTMGEIFEALLAPGSRA